MNTSGKTLSYGEQKALESKIQELKDAKGGKEVVQGVNIGAPNVQVLDRQVKRLEAVLSSQGVGEISDKEREKYVLEEKALKEDLRKGMPTWTQYANSRPKDGPRHDRIVEWIGRSNKDPVRQQKIRRWKTLARHLNPFDPKASHTNRLFPDADID